jgi:hypothetical protein
MSSEFNRGPGSQGEDRGEELGRFGEAPEAGSAWELGAGEESRASGDVGVTPEDDGGEAWDDLGAVSSTSPDESAPSAPSAGSAIRGSGVELPRKRPLLHSFNRC